VGGVPCSTYFKVSGEHHTGGNNAACCSARQACPRCSGCPLPSSSQCEHYLNMPHPKADPRNYAEPPHKNLEAMNYGRQPTDQCGRPSVHVLRLPAHVSRPPQPLGAARLDSAGAHHPLWEVLVLQAPAKLLTSVLEATSTHATRYQVLEVWSVACTRFGAPVQPDAVHGVGLQCPPDIQHCALCSAAVTSVCCAVLCCAVVRCGERCCAVLCCAVLCCGALWCAVVRGAVLCCAVVRLCYATAGVGLQGPPACCTHPALCSTPAHSITQFFTTVQRSMAQCQQGRPCDHGQQTVHNTRPWVHSAYALAA
jgi:hypothetical protein